MAKYGLGFFAAVSVRWYFTVYAHVVFGDTVKCTVFSVRCSNTVLKQTETKKPLQTIVCKGFWYAMIQHGTGIWWRRRQPKNHANHLK